MASIFDFGGMNRMRSRFIEMSKFGMKYDDLLVKNSTAIGFIEGELRKSTGASGVMADDLLRYSLAISDTTSQLKGKTLAFFQMDYIAKREKMRDMASNAEIEFVLENIADDVIIYGDRNKFCSPDPLDGKYRKQKALSSDKMEMEYDDKLKDAYNYNFDRIYAAWGFDSGISAWQYFYQFLIEGHLAFEIIYDDLQKPKEIIGFKELDPAKLYPIVQRDHTGNIYLQWLQQDDETGKHRELTDSQVIYLNYSNFFRTKRVSFVERMLRSFNLLRIIEHSKVIWHVMNAPLRLKTTVPVGTKSFQKAREDMNEFLNAFREDIFFNQDSGELMVDGKPKVLFYKNYVIPENDRGEKIDISALEYPGPDFQNAELLNYFMKKLKLDSKLPFSRWDYAEGGGSMLLGVENVNKEEITYSNFISRLRSSFCEVIIKPWYIQMCIDVPGLKDDMLFKNALGIKYEEENLFKRLKEQELVKKGAETIGQLKEIKDDNGDDYFSTDILVRKYIEWDDSDFEENEKLKALRKAEESEDGDDEGDDMGGGDDIGGDIGDIGGFDDEGGDLGDDEGDDDLEL